jgi:hypothetical protein
MCEDALGTLRLARMLMENPGTKLYDEALEKGWFRVDPEDYDCFDMTEPVLNTVDMESEEVTRICDEIYKIFLHRDTCLDN